MAPNEAAPSTAAVSAGADRPPASLAWPGSGWAAALSSTYLAHRAWIEGAITALSLAVCYGLLLADRALPRYVDEADNLLGGELIARGARLYVDFFSQHMPLPYFLAAIPALMGVHDLQGDRVAFSLITLAFLLGAVRLAWNRISPIFLWAVLLTFGVAHPMFSGYMFLADQLFGLSLLVVLVLLLVHDVEFTLPEQVVVSAAIYVATQSTLISVYPIGLMALYYVVRKLLLLRRSPGSVRWKVELRFVGIVVAPHVLTALAIVLAGMGGAFYDQAVEFNRFYYARYEIGGDPLSILARAVSDYAAVVVQYLRPSGLREIETFLIVSNVLAALVLWRKRDGLFALFYVGIVVLSRMRGAGYHGAPYFLVSFASIGIVLAVAVEQGWRAVQSGGRVGSIRMPSGSARAAALAVGVVLAGYVGLTAIFYHDVAGFYRRLPRGTELVSPYAPIVAAATDPNEPIWAAPFEPDVYFETGRSLASPDWYYHPWMADSEAVTQRVLSDLQRVRPPLVVFRAGKQIPWDFPLPTPAQYGQRVYAFIRDAYVPVDARDPVLRDVFVRKDVAQQRIERLASRGLVPTAPAASRAGVAG